MNGDDEFGVTAHLMDDKVDSGSIIECRNFRVKESDNLITLLDRTHDFLFCLFVELSTGISEKGAQYIEKSLQNNSYRWSDKKAKISEIDNLQIITPNISELELAKRIRSLNHPNFPLEVHIHNSKFIYKGEI